MVNDDASSLEDLKSITKHSGLHLTDAELESLHPLYQHVLEGRAILDDIELGPADLATIFIPDIDLTS